MKVAEFKRAQKHLAYFNNLSKICECFGINNLKYDKILTMDNGKEWLLDMFAKIDDYEKLVQKAFIKAKAHAKTKDFNKFVSGYTMGEFTRIVIESEFEGAEFVSFETIFDNRREYSGKKRYTIRFVKYEEKVK
jgi:hypothetical protein